MTISNITKQSKTRRCPTTINTHEGMNKQICIKIQNTAFKVKLQDNNISVRLYFNLFNEKFPAYI